jgi:branched-chain amino acid transport system ATP-binding protein
MALWREQKKEGDPVSVGTPSVRDEIILKVENASKVYFGNLAVKDMSLEVRVGETLAVIGPNGAGKSTFFGLIAGEHTSTRGRIIFNGRDVTGATAHSRARLGMSRTFQVAHLFASRTVVEHLKLAISAKSKGYRRLIDNFDRTSKRRQELIDKTLDELGLRAVSNDLASSLAQGDRKRLELAMAIVQEPRLLLLDEPTAGMSNEDVLLTVETFKAVQRAAPDLTIVLTGHDMEVLFALASRIILMADGEMVLDGTPDEVANSEIAREVYLGTKA